jgi:hypothetical protein
MRHSNNLFRVQQQEQPDWLIYSMQQDIPQPVQQLEELLHSVAPQQLPMIHKQHPIPQEFTQSVFPFQQPFNPQMMGPQEGRQSVFPQQQAFNPQMMGPQEGRQNVFPQQPFNSQMMGPQEGRQSIFNQQQPFIPQMMGPHDGRQSVFPKQRPFIPQMMGPQEGRQRFTHNYSTVIRHPYNVRLQDMEILKQRLQQLYPGMEITFAIDTNQEHHLRFQIKHLINDRQVVSEEWNFNVEWGQNRDENLNRVMGFMEKLLFKEFGNERSW